jgi:hypothetical protein
MSDLIGRLFRTSPLPLATTNSVHHVLVDSKHSAARPAAQHSTQPRQPISLRAQSAVPHNACPSLVTAVGLPVLLGMSSGLPTRKVVRGYWYNASRSCSAWDASHLVPRILRFRLVVRPRRVADLCIHDLL